MFPDACLNNDLNNMWAVNNTPTSWAHFLRQDLPVHLSIAEAWTVADMYQVRSFAALEFSKHQKVVADRNM